MHIKKESYDFLCILGCDYRITTVPLFCFCGLFVLYTYVLYFTSRAPDFCWLRPMTTITSILQPALSSGGDKLLRAKPVMSVVVVVVRGPYAGACLSLHETSLIPGVSTCSFFFLPQDGAGREFLRVGKENCCHFTRTDELQNRTPSVDE